MIEARRFIVGEKEPVLLIEGGGSIEVRLSFKDGLLVGGSPDGCTFPLEGGSHTFSVGMTEELWAVSDGWGDVEVKALFSGL